MLSPLELRFAAIQTHLVAKGVRDIKFYLDHSPDTSAIEVATEVAEALEADMNGGFRQVRTFAEIFRS